MLNGSGSITLAVIDDSAAIRRRVVRMVNEIDGAGGVNCSTGILSREEIVI
jgi:hypothetical protein